MVNLNHEFQRQYMETFVYIQEESGTKSPLFVLHTMGNEDGPITVTGSKLHVPRTRVRSAEVEVSIQDVCLTPIELGCIPLRGASIYFAWRQDRQWKRGFRRNRVNFRTAMSDVIPNREELLHGVLRSNEDVYHVFNPTYKSIPSAIQLINDGHNFSVPISRKFWIGLSPILNDLIIGYKMWPIGFLDEKNYEAVLLPDFEHIYEELSDLMDVRVYENLRAS